jgi:hypothetical protein
MLEIIEVSLLISLVTCGLNILFEYEEGLPKRYQMLFYSFRKWVSDKRKAQEDLRDKKMHLARDYYRNEINSLNGRQDIVDYKTRRYHELEENRFREIEKEFEDSLWYEWYLKPIFLCVYCMPSFWGTIIWVLLFGFTNPIQWALSLIISVFLNGLIWNIYKRYDNI